ncbi:MAG: hypothetical protein L0Y54_15075 [Sporichthyaceae bacterium]|nr:hypothetical protein [Sporichthyaceae bacterium]
MHIRDHRVTDAPLRRLDVEVVAVTAASRDQLPELLAVRLARATAANEPGADGDG